jgi:hypothetical protein
MTVTLAQAEEVAIFAARRAVATATFNRTFVETLRQLVQSDRRPIREHAVLLAHQAAAIEWACRQNRGGDAA